MLIFSRMHFKNHMLTGAQAVAVGGTHLKFTSNKVVVFVGVCKACKGDNTNHQCG